MQDFDNYLSPFSWRYGTPEMRSIWSETHKRRTWRKIWVHLAQVQAEFGLVKNEQWQDLQNNAERVDMVRALQIESENHHDLMAELKTFAEQSPLGGGILHLGATSMDIEDNADALRLRQALELTRTKLGTLLGVLADQIIAWADTPIIAFTHLQPAEPSTLGYRLASYAQDLLADWENLTNLKNNVKGKGFKGAVGTASAYSELLGAEAFSRFEARLGELLNLPFYPVATQVYPRKQDYEIVCALAGLGASLYKLAFDLRLLQSPVIGELSEPFGSRQVGSSAMPFKRNPINSEKVDSLARSLATLPQTAWHNAAHSLLERTLDDSANRRSLLPESFLICDELLETMKKVLAGLVVNPTAMENNLARYAPFASTERLMMALAKAGADRQQVHERLREHALKAWQAVQNGQPNPLKEMIANDGEFAAYLPAEEIASLLQVDQYLGIAPPRAREMAEKIRQAVS